MKKYLLGGNMKKIKKQNVSIVLIFLLFFLHFFLSNVEIIKYFDNKIIDFYFQIRGKIPTTNNIVIVDIDEKSLQKYGRWPWDRDKIAKLITNITNANPNIIGLDIFFSEKTNKDSILYNALINSPTILSYAFNYDKNFKKNPLPPPLFSIIEKGKRNLIKPKGYVSNIPLFYNDIPTGFINIIPDIDGVVRNALILLEFNKNIYFSFDFTIFALPLTDMVKIEYQPDVTFVNVSKRTIPLDNKGRLFINYRGNKCFKYISAADILDNNLNKNDIKNKIVLIGSSSIGIADLKPTPFNQAMPGIEIHANIIDNLIKGDFLTKPSFSKTIDLILFLISLLLITFFNLKFTPFKGFIFSIITLLAYQSIIYFIT